jgi:hypothetical protein
VIEAAGTIDGLWHALDSGPRFWHAARALGDLWGLLIGSRAAPDDIHVRVRLHEPETTVYWLSARTLTVTEAGAFRASPVMAAAVRDVDEYGIGIPCVASDSGHVSVAVATTDDHASLVLVVTQAARPGLRLREHTLSLWQRAVESWSRILAMSALAELARHVLVSRPAAIPDALVRMPDGRDAGPGRARLDYMTLRSLSGRLAEVAYAQRWDPMQLVTALLDHADLPDTWKRDIGGRTYGSVDDAARSLVRQLLEKGALPSPPGYTALAVVLSGNGERFGREDRELFCQAIAELRHAADGPLLEALSNSRS